MASPNRAWSTAPNNSPTRRYGPTRTTFHHLDYASPGWEQVLLFRMDSTFLLHALPRRQQIRILTAPCIKLLLRHHLPSANSSYIFEYFEYILISPRHIFAFELELLDPFSTISVGHILAPALLLSYILRVYFFRRTCNNSLAQSLSKSTLPTTSPEVFRLPSSFFKFSLHIPPPCSSFTGPHRPTLPSAISDHKYEAPLIFRHAHLRHSYLHSQRDSNRAPGLFPT